MNLRVFICFLVVGWLSLLEPLYAQSVIVYESPFSSERAKYKTEQLIKKLKLGNIKNIENTQGFDYSLKTKAVSLFRYQIFFGQYGRRKKNLIRLEGGYGQIFTLAQILEENKIIVEGSVRSDGEEQTKRKIKRKSTAGWIFINLISPTFAAVYEGADSPVLSRAEVTVRALVLFGVELGIVYLAGSNFLQTSFRLDQNRNTIINSLLLFRTAYAGFGIPTVLGHNHLFSLGYDFAY